MSRALQISYSIFETRLEALPVGVRQRIRDAIDVMGRDLAHFPHHRLTGINRCRLRVGDYRVIYMFDPEKNEIHLLAVGHRSKIYR